MKDYLSPFENFRGETDILAGFRAPESFPGKLKKASASAFTRSQRLVS